MQISFYNNNSKDNVLNKDIVLLLEKNITIKEKQNSILSPILYLADIQTENIGNYCYIEKWNRYYFIKNISFVNNQIIKLELETDFLMTFKNVILKSSGDITQSENIQNYASSYNVLDTTTQKIQTFSDSENKFTENNLYLIGAN